MTTCDPLRRLPKLFPVVIRLGGIVTLLLVSSGALANSDTPSQSSTRLQRLATGGRSRTFLLHTPAQRSDPHPLVIALHGHSGTATRMMDLTEFDRVTQEAGAVVAYPNGTGWLGLKRSWNAGACCGYAMSREVDDVDFLRTLIDHLTTHAQVDPQRVYVTGVSNGGMMAHRVGCELSDRITAIAVVAGALSITSCHPSAPVSVLMIHGTADQFVPYAGGWGARVHDDRIDPPVSHAVSTWKQANGCRGAPERESQGRILRETWSPCRSNTTVTLYTLRGEGHSWPGRRQRGARQGGHAGEFSATKVIWEFFQQHPKAQ